MLFAEPAVLPLIAAKESTDAQQHRRRKGAVIRRQRGMPRMLRQKALYARAVHQDIDQQPLASIFQRPQQRGPGGDQRHSQRQPGRVLWGVSLRRNGYKAAQIDRSMAEHGDIDFARRIRLIQPSAREDQRHEVKESSHQPRIGSPASGAAAAAEADDRNGKKGYRGELHRKARVMPNEWENHQVARKVQRQQRRADHSDRAIAAFCRAFA